ncbi:MAG: hypothetical protein R3C26_19435 [Calditrichia bacterium]
MPFCGAVGYLFHCGADFTKSGCGFAAVILAISALLFVPAVLLSLLWWPICNQIRRNRLSDIVFTANAHCIRCHVCCALAGDGFRQRNCAIPEIVSLAYRLAGIFAWLFPIGILLYAIITGGYYWLLSPKVIVAGSTQKARRTQHPKHNRCRTSS